MNNALEGKKTQNKVREEGRSKRSEGEESRVKNNEGVVYEAGRGLGLNT